MAHKKKILRERERVHQQGVSHRRWGLPKYYTGHRFQRDYDDGYHGRPFRKPGRRSIADRLRRAFFELFGG